MVRASSDCNSDDAARRGPGDQVEHFMNRPAHLLLNRSGMIPRMPPPSIADTLMHFLASSPIVATPIRRGE